MTDSEENQAEEERLRKLPAAARRALAEAEERRKVQKSADAPTEINGPKGEEPTRYGDWERNGRAIDF